jgi:L-amino acid N-acyltransferase YncA
MYDIFDMQQNDYAGIEDLTGFDPSMIASDKADQHFAALDQGGRIRARCSIWWRDTAIVDDSHTGAIGHYSADNVRSAQALLGHACQELKTRQCGYAIGPMDGNTWRNYRLITERGRAKPFFLEPDNPDEWPAHFEESGFSTYLNYVSEINSDFPGRQPELGNLRNKFADLGVAIEPLDLNCPAKDLADLYRVICEAFSNSPLYTPLTFDDFVTMYAPFLSTVDPRLMLIARHEGSVVGFVFAPPDYLESGDPEGIDTIVIKTIAILPQKKFSGLGRLLIVDMLQNAEAMGYHQAVSALMHTENRSQKISSDCAGPMRCYELFGRKLSA